MKCRYCNNEMERLIRDGLVILVCFHCDIKKFDVLPPAMCATCDKYEGNNLEGLCLFNDAIKSPDGFCDEWGKR